MKRISIVLLALLVSCGSICAQSKNLEKVIFTPQWSAQAQFAGYYAAKELGFYKEEGLDVEIVYQSTNNSATDMLGAGQTNIISSKFIEAIILKDKFLHSQGSEGLDLVNVMQVIPNSTSIILSQTPLNKSLDSLKNKKISISYLDYDGIITSLLRKKEIAVEWIKIEGGVNVFLSESVDATVGQSYSELRTVKETGKEIGEEHIIRATELGYDIPEDGLYTTAKYASKNKDIIERFKKASIKGWLWAIENEDKAVKFVIKETNKNNISTNSYHQLEMLKEFKNIGVGESLNSFVISEEEFDNYIFKIKNLDLLKTNVIYKQFIIK